MFLSQTYDVQRKPKSLDTGGFLVNHQFVLIKNGDMKFVRYGMLRSKPTILQIPNSFRGFSSGYLNETTLYQRQTEKACSGPFTMCPTQYQKLQCVAPYLRQLQCVIQTCQFPFPHFKLEWHYCVFIAFL